MGGFDNLSGCAWPGTIFPKSASPMSAGENQWVPGRGHRHPERLSDNSGVRSEKRKPAIFVTRQEVPTADYRLHAFGVNLTQSAFRGLPATSPQRRCRSLVGGRPADYQARPNPAWRESLALAGSRDAAAPIRGSAARAPAARARHPRRTAGEEGFPSAEGRGNARHPSCPPLPLRLPARLRGQSQTIS